MRINFNPINFQNTYKGQMTSAPRLNGQLSCDTVQFTGKHKKPQAEIPESVKRAVEFGEEIKSLADEKCSLEDLGELVHREIPDIEILDSKELQNIEELEGKYGAMYRAILGDNFEYYDKKLYFAQQKGTDFNEKLLFRMGSAHEYTHALQAESGRVTDYLKKACNGNLEQSQALMSVGERLFKIFDNEIQAYSVLETMRNTLTESDIIKYGGSLIPKEAEVSKKDMFASLRKYSNIPNEQAFMSTVNKKLKADFDVLLKQLKLYQPEIYEMLPEKNSPKKLYELVKQYVILKALDEEEAYTTEAIIAKEALGVKKINLDILPIYYHTLQEAFKNY